MGVRQDMGLLEYLRDLESEEEDLQRQLKEIRIAIAHARRRAEKGVIRATLPGAEPEDTPHPIDGPYTGLGVEEAAHKHLQRVGKPQKTAQVADALLAGGLQTDAKDFNSTVFGSLRRLVSKGVAQKLGPGKWAIASGPGSLL